MAILDGRTMRYTRLVTARRGEAVTLWLPAVGAAGMATVLASLPWVLQNPHLVRTYIDPVAKTTFVVVGGAATAIMLLLVILLIATGLGVLASVYGRRANDATVVLATPLGVLGLPRQKMRVSPGTVTVRLVAEPASAQVYRYGVQRVYFTQGELSLHTFSFVKYSEDSRARIESWLAAHGINAVFQGDAEVLPSH